MLLSVPRAFSMVWDRNCEAFADKVALHDDVTATLSYLNEPVLLKDPAHVARRKDAQFRHEPVPVS